MLPAPRHAAQSSLKAPSVCYPSAAAAVSAGRQHLPMRSPPAAPAAQHIHSALAAPRCVAAHRVGAAQPGAGAVPLCCRLAGAQRRAAGIRQRAQRSQNARQVPAPRVLPERGLDQHSVLREKQARGHGGWMSTAGAALAARPGVAERAQRSTLVVTTRSAVCATTAHMHRSCSAMHVPFLPRSERLQAQLRATVHTTTCLVPGPSPAAHRRTCRAWCPGRRVPGQPLRGASAAPPPPPPSAQSR